jgi:hypothetical protein
MVSKRERALETHQFLPINANLLGPESLSLSFGRPGQGLLQRRQEPFSGRIPERTRPAERPRVDNCHLPSTRPAPRCHGRCGFPRSNNGNVKFSGHAKRLSLAQDSKPLPRLCECATRFLLGGPCPVARDGPHSSWPSQASVLVFASSKVTSTCFFSNRTSTFELEFPI